MHKRRWFELASVVIVALALVASFSCAPTVPPAEMPEEILKIGHINPLTGGGAWWGEGSLNGALIAAEEINEAGGIVCQGTRYKIEVLSEDDKYTADVGLAAAHKLIYEDKVLPCLTGCLASAVVLALQGFTEPNNILMLCDTYTDAILTPEISYTYRCCLSPRQTVPTAYKWFHEEYPELKSMQHIAANDATGWGNAETSNELWGGYGEALEPEYYERGTTDFTPLVTRVMAKEPDWVSMAGTTPEDAALILKVFREMDFHPFIVHMGGLGDLEEAYEIAGAEAIDGAMAYAVDYSSPDAVSAIKDYYNKYMTKYGEWNDCGIWLGTYDQLYIIKDVIETAQSMKAEDMKAVLDDPNFRFKSIYTNLEKTGKFGGASFYGINHQAVLPIYIVEAREAKWCTIAKAELPADY